MVTIKIYYLIMKLNVYQKYNVTHSYFFDTSSKLYPFVSFASTSPYFLSPINKLKQTYLIKHTNLIFF